MTDHLDTAIREAFDDIVADVPALGPPPDASTGRQTRRRRVWPVTVAASALAVAGVGAVLSLRDGSDASGDQAVGGVDVVAGELTVAPGVTDYYVGPESLGEPDVDEDLFDLIRCTELDADGTCTAVQGPAWIPFVTHGRPLADSSTPVEPDDSLPVDDFDTVTVETVFSDVTAAEYAADAGRLGEMAVPVTVRGHAGLTFNGVAQSFVVWPERPGVLVAVGVAPDRADEAPAIAAAVRLVDGPTAIPDEVVIPGTRSFRSGNSADGLVVTHADDGTECVGMRFFEQDGRCPASIESLTWLDGSIEPLPPAEQAVVGAVPSEVTSVRVTPYGAEPITADTFAYADYSHRFFRVPVPPSVAVAVEWLAADGSVIADTDRVANGSGYGGPAGIGVMVIDGSGTPGAGDHLAARLTGPYRGESVGIGVDPPAEIAAAADGVTETVVYYNHGFFGDPPGVAVLFAERLGAGTPLRASQELTDYLGSERPSDDLIVVLGSDLAGEWAPG